MFLDTAGLYCLFDSDDERHEEAARLMTSARSPFTHSVVLAEFLPLVRTRRLNVDRAIDFLRVILANRDIETVWVGKEMLLAALTLLNKRGDKAYSLCDAIGFVLMRSRGVHEALTTDHHFEQEGFVRLLTG